MPTLDARQLNWRYIAPSEPAGLIVLPPADDSKDGGRHGVRSFERIIADGPYPAVVIPDAASAAASFDVPPRHLLESAAEAVAQGGWLLIGFSNMWSPLGRGRRLRLAAVSRLLERARLRITATYVPLPDTRHPAVLVPMERAYELDHVLRAMFLTYLPPDSSSGLVGRRLLPLARSVALRTPHRLRKHFAPAYFLIATRLP